MKFPKAKTLLVFVLLISLVLIPAVHSQVIEDIDDDDENVNNNNNAAPATADAPVKSEEPAAAAAAAPAATEENAPAPKAEPAYNFDEDEFEGIEELKKKKKNINNKAQKIDSETLDRLTTAAKQQQQQQGKKMSTFEVLTQAFKDKTIWDFKMEFGFIGFVLVYTLFVFIGKTQNQNYVVRFVNTAADFLTHNFAVIGSSTALKAGTCGDKVSLHEFNLPLTGRRNMKAACLHFILRPRQDMLTNILYKFFGWKDQLTIECLMPEFEPFCFCIAKKSAFRGIQEASYDIKNFAQKHKDYKNLSSDFVVAYDSPEVARLIDKFAKTIAAYKEYFVSLHVTDQPTIFQTHPHALKMELALPGDVEANAEAINALLNLFVNVVDDAANFRLSNAENSKNLEIRLAYKKREQAKEGSADSKDGGSSVEKELTPEQLKKQEERKMRRRMNRVMKVKVK